MSVEGLHRYLGTVLDVKMQLEDEGQLLCWSVLWGLVTLKLVLDNIAGY